MKNTIIILIILSGSLIAQYYGWEKIYEDPDDYVISVTTLADGTLFVATSNGNVLHSTDHGDNWSTIASPADVIFKEIYSKDFYPVYAYDDTTLWKIESNHNLTKVLSTSGISYLEISGDSCFVYTSDSTLYISKDRGENWSTRHLSIEFNTENILYNDGILLGANNQVLYHINIESGEYFTTDIPFTTANNNRRNFQSFLDTLYYGDYKIGLYSSSDKGVTWWRRSSEPCSDLQIDRAGMFWKLNLGLHFSGDFGKSWKPGNASLVVRQIFNIQGSIKYFTGFDIEYPYKRYLYRSTEPDDEYVGQNYYPLHVGNRWLYKTTYSSMSGGAREFSEREVVSTYAINGETYYKFNDKNYLDRYEDNIVFRYDANINEELVHLNFNYFEGTYYYRYITSAYGTMVETLVDNIQFLGEKNCKGVYPLPPGSGSRDYFAENIGLIKSVGDGNPSTVNELLSALIIDENGDTSFYPHNGSPELELKNVTLSGSGKLILNMNIEHPLDIHKYMFYTDEVSFVESFTIEYFFTNEGINSDTSHQTFVCEGIGENDYMTNIPYQNLLDGQTLHLQITAKDKGIIPKISSIPSDSSYFFIKHSDHGITLSNEELYGGNGNNGQLYRYDLSQNYPNPFNPVTKIEYELVRDSEVELIVYDITGKKVKVLASGVKSKGRYSAYFDGSNLSSGVYFYQLNVSDISGNRLYTKSNKMVLLK